MDNIRNFSKNEIFIELIERAFCEGYEYAQKEFGAAANKAAKKAWEIAEGKKVGDWSTLDFSNSRVNNALNRQREHVERAEKKWMNYRKGNESKELGFWNGDSKAKMAQNHYRQTRGKDGRLEGKFRSMRSDLEYANPARRAAFREAAAKHAPIDRLDSMKIEREFLKDKLNAKKLAKNIMKSIK